MKARGAGLIVASLVAMSAGSGVAQAAGFALREGSADWMANAFAGETAKAYDASTAFTNPAGIVRLNANEVDASVNGLFPSSRFSGANFVGPGATTPGTEGGNVVQSAATFGTFAVWSYAPDLKFGFAATAPFGQRISNESNFVGRYQSLVSTITDLNFSISAAYRINDHISIGGGPVIEYLRPRLTQAVNIGINQRVGDPILDLRGDDVSAGYNLGALYQFNDDTRVGIDYRSRITHGIEVTRSVFVPPLLAAGSPPTAARLRLLNSSAATQITLPDTVTLGFYHQIDPRWAVMADLQWTHWSLLHSVAAVPSNGGPVTVLPLNWRSTWFGSVGASYRVTQKLLLQAGFGYDESPVTDSNRSTRIPDSDRFDLGVGATYAVLPNVNLQAAYLHAFVADGSINNEAVPPSGFGPGSGVIVGKYHNSGNAISLGATVKF